MTVDFDSHIPRNFGYVGISRFVSCPFWHDKGILVVKGGNCNGPEKNWRVFERTPKRKRSDTRTVIRDFRCDEPQYFQMGKWSFP